MAESPQELIYRLFIESRDALRRQISRLVRSADSTDDIVQEAFLRTYQNADSVHAPRAFLFTTARNLAVDLLRRNREKPDNAVTTFDTPDISVDTGASSPDQIAIAEEASRILKQAIDLLPPQRRAALTLRVFHGHSYKEIGAILGLAERTVENQVGRGLNRVHEYVRARYSEIKDSGGHGG